MRLTAGSVLGPYEISSAIGAGGMGEVYRARDTRLGREVALKVLPEEVSRDRQRMARFEREARAASALNHRNIVTVHEFASAEGRSWLVMELVRGESLREVLARGPLPMKRLLPIAAGIAEGMAVAHAAGMVHRDLKPENLMISEDGTPKILDFGLVKHDLIDDGPDSPTDLQVSRAGFVLGTAGYMSPEQARGEPVDFRSDQFSFGLVLYEMATGTHPFRRSSSVETLAAILGDEPAPLGKEISEPFAWVLERCLAKRPADRYGSSSDLARDLMRLRDRPLEVSVIGSEVRKAHPERSAFWLAGAALLAALLTVAIMMMLRPKDSPARVPVQTAVVSPEVKEVLTGEVSLPVVISPDGRHLVIRGVGRDGTDGLWLHELRSGRTRLLADKGFSAGFSSDGTAVAYMADGKLKTVPVEGGPARVLCDARPEGTPDWRGDTILFAQFAEAPGIYRVSAAGGVPELIVPPDPAPGRGLPWWPHLLPDGKRFLYLSFIIGDAYGEIRHELMMGSLDGDPAIRIAELDSRAIYVDGQLLFVRDGTLLAQPFDLDAARLTGEPRPLVDDLHYFRNTGLSAFSASENGLLVWRTATRPRRLVWLDRIGTEVGTVATDRFEANGRLSSDGTRYAAGVIDRAQGVADLWIYDLVRENPARITFQLLDERAPVWTLDGRALYYRSDGGGGPPDIMVRRLGEERSESVYRGPGVQEPQDVSADGRWLLYVDYFATGADVNVLPLHPPGPPQAYLATPFNEVSPRFSPDVRWVAYSSDVSGRTEVYVRQFEGSEQAIRISKEGGTRPRWRGDGTELFYLAPGGRLMTVPVASGFGNPRVLFQTAEIADYEPAADGSRFLVQLDENAGEPAIHILADWQARLDR